MRLELSYFRFLRALQKIIFRFGIKAVFAKFISHWLQVQGFHQLLATVAIHASKRQATFYGIHGSLAARQLQVLAVQTSGVLASNYAIKRDLRENTGFKFINGRVGPLFWLLGP